ncbi:MAG TPA: hypothetical protein VGA85_07900 [Dehalococcoidales bacterium]
MVIMMGLDNVSKVGAMDTSVASESGSCGYHVSIILTIIVKCKPSSVYYALKAG